jgi:homoserine kinase type II
MSDDARSELQTILGHYDLGTLTAYSRDQRGTVNTSYVIELVKGGARRKYFLRRYKQGILEQEIVCEHSLLTHLRRRGSCPVAAALPAKDGQTYLRPGDGPGAYDAFYAIFDFLPGEDRYSWVDPHCTPGELRASGRLLAQFHSDAQGFVPRGHREEPKTVELLSRIDKMWADAPRMSKRTVFDHCVEEHFHLLQDEIRSTLAVLGEPAAGALPEVFIHSDYHPGNLRFRGHSISGLVDFDWAKRDWRSFDVALALWYFCVSWVKRSDGRLRLGEARTFLDAYQGRLVQGAEIAPLNSAEVRYLPDLLRASNIYVLYWTLRDYMNKAVDPVEYLGYLQHHVAFARWFGRPKNRLRFEALAARLPALAGGQLG